MKVTIEPEDVAVIADAVATRVLQALMNAAKTAEAVVPPSGVNPDRVVAPTEPLVLPVKPKRTRGPNKPKVDPAAPAPQPGAYTQMVEANNPPVVPVAPTLPQMPMPPINSMAMMPTTPAPQPIIQGNVHLFPAARNHPTQMNAAVDITTGQPIGLPPMPTGPVMPQFSSAPPIVMPAMGLTPPPQVVAPMPVAVTADTAKAAALMLRNNTEVAGGGPEALRRAMAAAGVPSMAGVTDQNAPYLYHAVELAKAGAL